jgi:hypothetical protein
MATNAECAAQQAAIRFTCAGPSLLSREQSSTGEAKRQRLAAEGDMAGLRAFVAELDSVLHRAPKLATDAGMAALDDALTRLLYARAGCGADLSAALAAASFDGEIHTGTCAACGTAFTFRPPLSDEEAAGQAARKAAALSQALV